MYNFFSKIISINRLAFLTIIIVCVYEFINVWFGIDTIFDEGFLVLKSKENKNGDFTQAFRIINLLLNHNIQIISLKLMKFILIFSTILIVISNFKIKDVIVLFTLLIIPSFFIYTNIVSYNHFSFFSLFFSIFVYLKSLNSIFFKKWFFIILSPVFILSILSIPSNGVLLIILILTIYFYESKFYVTDILKLIFGLILSFFLYNIFIDNILFQIDDIYYSLKQLSDSGRGYSFVIQFKNYIVDLSILTFFFIVNYFICFIDFKFKRNKNTLLILVNIVLSYFFSKYELYIFILPVVYIIFNNVFFNRTFRNYIFNYLIFVSPFILSIGTNTSLFTKSIYYLPIWILLFKNARFNVLHKSKVLLLISVIFFMLVKEVGNRNINGNIFTSNTQFNNFDIKLRKKQQK